MGKIDNQRAKAQETRRTNTEKRLERQRQRDANNHALAEALLGIFTDKSATVAERLQAAEMYLNIKP